MSSEKKDEEKNENHVARAPLTTPAFASVAASASTVNCQAFFILVVVVVVVGVSRHYIRNMIIMRMQEC